MKVFIDIRIDKQKSRADKQKSRTFEQQRRATKSEKCGIVFAFKALNELNCSKQFVFDAYAWAIQQNDFGAVGGCHR